MRRAMMGVCILVLAVGVFLGGCKDNLPLSELERFVQRTEGLDGQALDDTLRSFLTVDPPYSTYASYMLGNRIYAAATDSAMNAGWSNPAAIALLDSAEFFFNRAVAQDSTFLEALVNLGSLWDDRSQQVANREELDFRVGQAENFYRRALAVDPTDEKARCNLGSLFLRMRRTEEALNEFKTVIKNDPKSSLAHYNLAIMFAEAKIYREAIVEWQLAAKFDPQGDIGGRSRDNIKIVNDLMNAPTPDSVK